VPDCQGTYQLDVYRKEPEAPIASPANARRKWPSIMATTQKEVVARPIVTPRTELSASSTNRDLRGMHPSQWLAPHINESWLLVKALQSEHTQQ
jgi:hypothetical protein